MKFFALLAAVGLAAAAEITRCGTPDPDDSLKMQLNEAYFSHPSYNKIAAVNESRVIDTYVHVVTTKASRRNYTKTMIHKQVCVATSHVTKLFTDHNPTRWTS